MFALYIHSGGGTTYEFMGGLTEEEAIEIGNKNGWRWIDENCFEWSMTYDEQ